MVGIYVVFSDFWLVSNLLSYRTVRILVYLDLLKILKMSAINIELLILEVKKYELLYKQEHPQYKDYRQKDRIFDNEISKAMGGENGK